MASCCMPGGCGDPTCYLCTVVAELPQPVFRDQTPKGKATRDGAPKLAGERKRDLIFKPRKRVGPFRGNA